MTTIRWYGLCLAWTIGSEYSASSASFVSASERISPTRTRPAPLPVRLHYLIAPVTGATNVMGVQIGEKRAKELSMLCRRYSADDALRMGLVNAVVDDDQLESTVEAWCDELAALSPRYLEITKISSNVWWNAARDSFSTGLGMLVQAIGSQDMVEGASAFLEKRRPQFPDPE